MNDNDRGDLPSASAVQRYMDCPGSFLLSKGVTEVQTPEMAAYAAAGDRVHMWLEDPDFITLDDPKELEVAEECAEQRKNIVDKIFGENANFAARITEDRLWLKVGKSKIFSGKPDGIFIYGDTALIIDFKTGYGDTPESPKNMQLRALAVLLIAHPVHGPKIKTVYVAIIQPLVNREAMLTRYETEDLGFAHAELRMLLDDINKPDAPRKAGDCCKFCPAKFKCVENRAMMEKLGSEDVNAADMQKLADLLNTAHACEAVIKAIRARAKGILKENPAAIPGWTIGKGASMRSISDPFALFKVLSDAALLTRDQFLSDCVSVGVGDLESAIAKHNNLKPKEAKEKVNAFCSDFIELKTKEGSLEKL